MEKKIQKQDQIKYKHVGPDGPVVEPYKIPDWPHNESRVVPIVATQTGLTMNPE